MNMKKAISSLVIFLSALPALAQEDVAGAIIKAASSGIGNSGLFALGAGLAIGVAALGGALAQGKIGSAAMDGIARNPQAQKSMFVPMIIGLVLVESLVIYSLVIAFMLVGKI